MASRGPSNSFELLILRTRKLITSFTSAPGRRALCLGTVSAIEHRRFLRRHQYDFIVDVGANRGQFLLAAARACPRAVILCYEPLSEPFRILEIIAMQLGPRVRCFRTALGDYRGNSNMFVTKDDDSSSLLEPSSAQIELSPNSFTTSWESVLVDRLDGRPELDLLTTSNALLKIDVQGFELNVIRGAGIALSRFQAVYVECSFVELYEGQSLAEEVTSYLSVHHFVLVETFNMIARDGRPIQADLLFVRAETQ